MSYLISRSFEIILLNDPPFLLLPLLSFSPLSLSLFPLQPLNLFCGFLGVIVISTQNATFESPHGISNPFFRYWEKEERRRERARNRKRSLCSFLRRGKTLSLPRGSPRGLRGQTGDLKTEKKTEIIIIIYSTSFFLKEKKMK